MPKQCVWRAKVSLRFVIVGSRMCFKRISGLRHSRFSDSLLKTKGGTLVIQAFLEGKVLPMLVNQVLPKAPTAQKKLRVGGLLQNIKKNGIACFIPFSLRHITTPNPTYRSHFFSWLNHSTAISR
jgi:hypothetical protein